jgi:hypothetical protein
LPHSLPALAAGILQSHTAWRVRSAAEWFESAPLVPAYHVDDTLTGAEQQRQAVQAIAELAQKLERLGGAYGKWATFAAGPYFDLYPTHAARFCRFEQTQHTVRIRLYGDLLLPAFRHAERYWVETFLPAYHAGAGGADSAFGAYLVEDVMPELAQRLSAAEQAIQGVLDLLGHSVTILNLLGGLEERIQHRPQPGARAAPLLLPALQRLPRAMPTLTLDAMLPQPEPFEDTLARSERATQRNTL